jgi:hypothetical protein
METNCWKIYENSDNLVKDLKKKFKIYKKQIKEKTTKSKRFPFVVLDKCLKLDQYSIDVKNYGFNRSNDQFINKLVNNMDLSSHSMTNNKKRKFENSFINLCEINDENEELDYEMSDEENNGFCFDKKTNNSFGFNHKNNRNEKFDNYSNKTEVTKKLKSNHLNSKQDYCNGLSVYQNNNTNELNFKIPKKESYESVVSYVNNLIKNNKRCGDAYKHLCRQLNDNQWNNSDIIEIVAKIALGIANSLESGSHVNNLEEVIDKIKTLQHIDDDFWDELILRVDKRRNDGKCKYIHVRHSSIDSKLFQFFIIYLSIN